MQEMFTKDLEELKDKQMGNTLEGIHSRKTEAEARISDLEGRTVEITAAEQNREKRKKRNEDSPRDLWDNIKHEQLHYIEVSEGERKKGSERIFEEIVAENFPIVGKEISNQVQEVQRARQDKPKEEHTEKHQTDKN